MWRISLVVLALVLFISAGLTAFTSINLNTTTAPGSVAPGQYTLITGAPWPAMTAADVTVHIGPTCLEDSTAELTTANFLQPIMGQVKRARFEVPADLSPGTYQVWVSGSAAGGFDSDCTRVVVE